MPSWLPNRTAPIVALLRAFSRCMWSPTLLFRVSLLLVCSTSLPFSFARWLDVHMAVWDAGIAIQGRVLVSVLPISSAAGG
jgi:hypothetical protein